MTPIRLREDRTLQQQLEIDLKQGFNRVEVNGEMKRIDDTSRWQATKFICW